MGFVCFTLPWRAGIREASRGTHNRPERSGHEALGAAATLIGGKACGPRAPRLVNGGTCKPRRPALGSRGLARSSYSRSRQAWRRRADDAARRGNRDHPGAGFGAGGAAHYRLEPLPRGLRGGGQPVTGLSVRVNGTIDARILPSPVITLRNVEVGAAGRAPQLRAGMLKLELGLGADAARRGAGFRGAPHRAADQPRARPFRRHRLAGAVAVVSPGDALHLPSQRRGRPRHSHRCSVRLAPGAAEALVQRRYSLVHRTVQRRRRLCRRRRALRLSDIGRSRGRRRRRGDSRSGSASIHPIIR